uniref:Uncharacterized protein n=1 Tax=Setaria italica TaxID=4555 RepID=K3YNS6_SETIT
MFHLNAVGRVFRSGCRYLFLLNSVVLGGSPGTSVHRSSFLVGL